MSAEGWATLAVGVITATIALVALWRAETAHRRSIDGLTRERRAAFELDVLIDLMDVVTQQPPPGTPKAEIREAQARSRLYLLPTEGFSMQFCRARFADPVSMALEGDDPLQMLVRCKPSPEVRSWNQIPRDTWSWWDEEHGRRVNVRDEMLRELADAVSTVLNRRDSKA